MIAADLLQRYERQVKELQHLHDEFFTSAEKKSWCVEQIDLLLPQIETLRDCALVESKWREVQAMLGEMASRIELAERGVDAIKQIAKRLGEHGVDL